MSAPDHNPPRGRVVLTRRQGDRVYLDLGDRRLGYVEFLKIPHGCKVSVGFTFDRTVRITREEPRDAGA
jgi:hypothetical protein